MEERENDNESHGKSCEKLHVTREGRIKEDLVTWAQGNQKDKHPNAAGH